MYLLISSNINDLEVSLYKDENKQKPNKIITSSICIILLLNTLEKVLEMYFSAIVHVFGFIITLFNSSSAPKFQRNSNTQAGLIDLIIFSLHYM